MTPKPKFFEKEASATADFYYGALVIILALVIGVPSASKIGNAAVRTGDLLVVGALSLIWEIGLLWHHIRERRWLTHRSSAIFALAAGHSDWQYSGTADLPAEFAGCSLLTLATRNLEVTDYIIAPVWSYVGLDYGIFRQTRYGEYQAATVYHAAVSMELPRVLPNVLFVSKNKDGREIAHQFAADQRHELEGDFNDYFETYFAEGYTVDSLSFITPDVMEEVKAAQGYDVEIVGNCLIVFGPLAPMPDQLSQMVGFAQAIQAKLAISAAAYRDDRLPSEYAGQTVTAQGLFLKPRRKHIIATVIVALLYVAIQIFAQIKNN